MFAYSQLTGLHFGEVATDVLIQLDNAWLDGLRRARADHESREKDLEK